MLGSFPCLVCMLPAQEVPPARFSSPTFQQLGGASRRAGAGGGGVSLLIPPDLSSPARDLSVTAGNQTDQSLPRTLARDSEVSLLPPELGSPAFSLQLWSSGEGTGGDCPFRVSAPATSDMGGALSLSALGQQDLPTLDSNIPFSGSRTGGQCVPADTHRWGWAPITP